MIVRRASERSFILKQFIIFFSTQLECITNVGFVLRTIYENAFSNYWDINLPKDHQYYCLAENLNMQQLNTNRRSFFILEVII